jgi:hypothetical protein
LKSLISLAGVNYVKSPNQTTAGFACVAYHPAREGNFIEKALEKSAGVWYNIPRKLLQFLCDCNDFGQCSQSR